MESKACTKCGEVKSLDEFWKQASSRNGICPWCKDCKKAKKKEYLATERGRELNREGRRRYNKTDFGKRRNYERVRAYEQKNKHIRAAHVAVRKLPRQPCEVCGSEKSEAHHPDYAKPLDVVWLCRLHHKESHAT